jgi:hypothetical protein
MGGVRDFEELVSWQRMHQLNIEVWKATEEGRAGRDFDFRDEIRDAADSAERNIAEGFGRFRPLVSAVPNDSNDPNGPNDPNDPND